MAMDFRRGAVRLAWIIVTVLAIYIPLRFFLIDYGPLAFTPVHLDRAASLAFRFGTDILAVVLVACLWAAKGIKGFRFQWIDYTVLLFVLVSFLSMVVNHTSFLRFGATMRGLFVVYVVGFVMARLPRDPVWFRRAMWASGVTLGLILFVGFLQALGWPEPKAWIEAMTGINAGRMMSLLENPNTLASYLVIMFFLGILVLPEKHRPWMAAILPVLYYTFSRSGWLGFVVGLVAAWRLLPWRQWAKILGIGAIITALIVAVNLTFGPPLAHFGFGEQLGANPFNRVTKTLSQREIGNSMFNGRLFILKIALNTVKERPLLGYGSGTFGGGGTVVKDLAKRYHMPTDMYSDSQYNRIIIETGLLGFLSFGLIHLVLLWKSWKAGGKIRYAGLALILAIVVMDAFNNLWELQQVMFPFWMLAALSYLRRDGWSLGERSESSKPGIG
ncbi:MAG: O-antigen ligase family protein [Kyrpidia tusciae]|nr:O-antigen ligase family protein [Kyrpidia tusciae]